MVINTGINMTNAAIPANEAQRLQSLRDLFVLDTEPKRELDGLVKVAALVCGVPISLISLVDADRQWFKANLGLDGVTETPRDIAFCSHTILESGIFEVQDATADPRFANNPLVTANPNIRFYAGTPLQLSDGTHAGSLCVIDRQPRSLTETQREILTHLGAVAVKVMEGRRISIEARNSNAQFLALSESSPLGVYATDAQGNFTYTNDRWRASFGLSAAESLGSGWSSAIHPDERAAVFEKWQICALSGVPFEMEFRLQRKDGTQSFVRTLARAVVNGAGDLLAHVGTAEDITERMGQSERLRRSELLLNSTGEVSGVGGWELDISTGELAWTDQTCRIHGLPPGHQSVLSEAISFYAPEAQPVISAAVEQAMVCGTGWDLELDFIQATGQAIKVRAMGHAEFKDSKPVRLIGTFQNVTEAAALKAALETANERILLATDAGCIGVWDLDLLTDKLVMDPRMYQLYGLTERTATGAYALWTHHLHPDDREAAIQAVKNAIAAKSEFNAEFRIVWNDGSIHHMRSAGRVRQDKSGKAIRLVGVNWDVSPIRRLTADLAEQHELLRVTLMSIGDAVITTDKAGCVQWMNPVAERLTGWLNTEARGRDLAQVFHIVSAETRLPAESPIAVCLAKGAVAGLASQTVLVSRNGDEFGVEDSAAPIWDSAGEIQGVVLVFHDVTEQRRLSGEMSYRASHDPLTGLLNRAEFEIRLGRMLQKSHGDHSTHALMFIDLDQFKLVNDACGHSVGDQLLQQVSKLLGESVRARDTLARLGGDEFGILLDHCTIEQAQRVAQLICDKMEEFRFLHDERRFRIGTSIGLVPMDHRWATTAAAMQAADTSCYAAKEAGRNRVHTWYDTDALMKARHGEMQWTSRIERALDENRFVLYAQKIVPLKGNDAKLHAEVLLRMLDTDGTIIPPGAFLPAAERFNLASRIDKWVLRHAIEWLCKLPDQTVVGTLSINLSGQSIGDRTFHRHALDLLTSLGRTVCGRICLEITETAAITNMADAGLFIEQARALGVQIALDDFGAGASSFGYLKSLKIDVLKIDGQFVKDLIEDPLDDAAVRCFVDVAKVVGVKTVAEFVDRGDVLARIKALGVDYGQGFLLHKPEPLAFVLAATAA